MLTRRGRAVVAGVALTALGTAVASPGHALEPDAPVETVASATPAGPGSPAGAGTAEPAATPLPGLAEVPSDPRPNVVVVMADDMRDDEVRWMPNLQRLLGEGGVRFENSFSPHPICCPARASFVSGQYTHNHGVWSNGRNFGFGAYDDRHSLATELSEVGYNTAFLGKYLNGYGAEPPHDGSAEDSLTYVPPGWTDWRGAVGSPPGWDSEEAGGTYRYRDTTLNVNGTLRGNQGWYQTEMLGTETEDVIGQFARSPRPFFLWASYVAPHIGLPDEADDPPTLRRSDGVESRIKTPARPPRVWGLFDDLITEAPGAAGEADVSDKPYFIRSLPEATAEEREAMATLTRQRAESLYVLDEQIGRTAEALEAAGELDDTIFMFTSDNGFFIGEHRMRSGKLLPYEPSLRVPTLMSGPGIPAGQTRRDPFLTIDFAPTILDAAGARPDPAMDGVSQLEVARTGDRGWTRGVLTESGPLNAHKYPRGPGPLLDVRPGGPSPLRFSQGVRTDRYLYVEYASREQELYDLRRDPGQLENLADEPATAPVVRVVRQLARELDRLRMCRSDGCATPLPADLQAR